MVEYITIGKIPENCKSTIICCGDYSLSDTIEFVFEVGEKQIVGIDNGFSCDVSEKVFKANSQALRKISEYIRPHGIKLSTNSLYNGFKLLINKKDSFSQKFSIVDSEGGEFKNQNLQYNGLHYLRRSVEKNYEMIEESICIKRI
jgi:hypothetical protein|tara:strand:+ start:280 stop:714 length:435 start_codon:yes stop_codon:yes gene_type:complete